jgi:hypothetical protein
LVEREGRRERPVGLDVGAQVGDLLLRSRDGVGTREEAPGRRLLPGDGEQRLRELRRVARLLPVRRLPRGKERRAALA